MGGCEEDFAAKQDWCVKLPTSLADVLSLLPLRCQIKFTHNLVFRSLWCATQCHLILECYGALMRLVAIQEPSPNIVKPTTSSWL
jgi:hypothetical protein